jgi:hypothetical protein
VSRLPLALDTNLLLLLVVGRADRRLVSAHRRLRRFEPWQLDRLVPIVWERQQLVVTAHVLAETSNLLRSGGLAPLPLAAASRMLRRWIEGVREEALPAVELVRDVAAFDRLGLTDLGLLTLAERGTEVLTVDFDLVREGERRRLPVTSFTRITDPTR